MPTLLQETEIDSPAERQPVSPLTIQEMARQSGLSEHTLRYYERIGLITPIPRDDSSGHRRYPPETVGLVESLACLRGTGMSIEDMRSYLKLRERGRAGATDQRALFASLKTQLEQEMALMETRLTYISGKVAYWDAVALGDTDQINAIAAANRRLAQIMTNASATISSTTQKDDS